jgi:sec-independent protein translocase protein TatC
MLKFKLSFMLGLILAFPYLVIQLWGFVEPGLKENEKRPVRKMLPFSVLLFAMGVCFCWIILPSAFNWFAAYVEEFPGTVIYQEPGTMVFFILKMLLAFGMGFQLPLVVFLLGKIGLLTPETLTTYWRQSTVFIFVASAIITPSNDVFSMLMMAIPLSVLFIISIWALKITNRKKPKPDDQDDGA